MTISFNLVPANIRVPGTYVEIDNSKALRGLPQYQNRILVIGQRTSAGTVAAAVPTLVTSAEQAKSYFGKGSILARMFSALKANNKYIETWAVALDDHASGVAASGTLTVTGPATESGSIYLYMAGERIIVPVESGDAQNTIAAAINAKINENVDLPVTSGVLTNVVTVTARNDGTLGNDIDIRLNFLGAPGGEKTPAGVAVAIVAMASGATDSTVATAIAALPDEIYDYIVMPYTDSTNMTAMKTELEDRWGPLRMLEGHCFIAKRDTVGNLTTYGNAQNSPHVTCLGIYNTPTWSPEIAAALVAQVGYAASIDPARPFKGLPLRGVLAPPESDRFTIEERNTLYYDGIANAYIHRDGTVMIERVITMYQTNAVGAVDPSYLDFNTLATLAYLRQTLRDRLSTKFPRYKIANDGTRFGAGQAIVTPKILKMEVLALFRLWEQAGLTEDFEQFKTEIIVERNDSDPTRVDMQLPPNLVNGLQVIAAQIQYLL